MKRVINSQPDRKSDSLRDESQRAISERWVSAIVSPGEITELFIKGLPSTVDSAKHLVGFYDYDHLDMLASDAAKYSGDAAGIYIRLNAVKPALLSRSPNQLRPVNEVQCGKNDDILRRRLMMIDIDPARPSGINATDDERGHARRLGEQIVEYLRGEGWPLPAHIDTGNGYCLMYRVELRADEGELIRRALRTLSDKFSTTDAHVDVVVHDAARLGRLPGTMNCKGPPKSNRPQRRCRLLRLPKQGLTTVPRHCLEALTVKHRRSEVHEVNNSIDVNDDVVRLAAKYIAEMPPAIEDSGGDSATFTVACRLVIGFGMSPDEAMPLIRKYNERCQPAWPEAELRRKLEAAEDRARSTGENRGSLLSAVPTNADLPSLDGPTFVGHVPDFGVAGTSDVLAGMARFATFQQHDWIEYMATWQKLREGVYLPDVYLRQCWYGASHPKNWRREIKNKLDSDSVEDQIPGAINEPELCLLCGTGAPHTHFPCRDGRWGVLEHFAYSDDQGREFLLYHKENSKLRKSLRSERKLIRVYWPALVLGAAKPLNWTSGQQRLLVGLVAELTHATSKEAAAIGRGEVISGNRVPGSHGKTHTIACPYLDIEGSYVTFGGNGMKSMRGRGYQLVGKNGGGWLYKSGYPDCRSLRSQTRKELIGQFLQHIETLAADLDLTVVGYHPRHRIPWRGIAELVQCLKTGNGQDWLEECCLRVYAPADWLTRWRHFFSKRLGFRWIPSGVGDDGPWSEAAASGDCRQISRGHHIRQLLCGLGWTQQRLADEASKKLGETVSRRRVLRHVQDISRCEDFLGVLETIRREKGIDLPFA